MRELLTRDKQDAVAECRKSIQLVYNLLRFEEEDDVNQPLQEPFMSQLPDEVKKPDIHDPPSDLSDWLFGFYRYFRDRYSFKAAVDLRANFHFSTKKHPSEVDDARK